MHFYGRVQGFKKNWLTACTAFVASGYSSQITLFLSTREKELDRLKYLDAVYKL